MTNGRLLLVFLAIAAALTLVGCSKTKETATDLIFAKAYAASVEEITSYRLTTSITVTAEGIGEIDTSEGVIEFLAPDRVHISETDSQHLIIGGTHYVKHDRLGISCAWSVVDVRSSTPQTGEVYGKMVGPMNLDFLNSPPEGTVRLADEIIDGVKTWHFKLPTRTTDPVEKMLEEIEKETDPEMKERLQKLVPMLREQSEHTFDHESWIGQDDYLVRQTKIVTSHKTGSLTYGDITVPS